MMQILRSIPELSQITRSALSRHRCFRRRPSRSSGGHFDFCANTPGGKWNAVVVTFDPHPEKILRPDKAPHLLTATQHKIALIRDLGVRIF